MIGAFLKARPWPFTSRWLFSPKRRGEIRNQQGGDMSNHLLTFSLNLRPFAIPSFPHGNTKTTIDTQEPIGGGFVVGYRSNTCALSDPITNKEKRRAIPPSRNGSPLSAPGGGLLLPLYHPSTMPVTTLLLQPPEDRKERRRIGSNKW